jgi:hypothetical protein
MWTPNREVHHRHSAVAADLREWEGVVYVVDKDEIGEYKLGSKIAEMKVRSKQYWASAQQSEGLRFEETVDACVTAVHDTFRTSVDAKQCDS